MWCPPNISTSEESEIATAGAEADIENRSWTKTQKGNEIQHRANKKSTRPSETTASWDGKSQKVTVNRKDSGKKCAPRGSREAAGKKKKALPDGGKASREYLKQEKVQAPGGYVNHGPCTRAKDYDLEGGSAKERMCVCLSQE